MDADMLLHFINIYESVKRVSSEFPLHERSGCLVDYNERYALYSRMQALRRICIQVIKTRSKHSNFIAFVENWMVEGLQERIELILRKNSPGINPLPLSDS